MRNSVFPFSQEQNGNPGLQQQATKTARLSEASIISYASHFSRTTRRDSEASSVDSRTIKDFFKNMMGKLCPDRPRYFNQPLEDKHDFNDEVGLFCTKIILDKRKIVIYCKVAKIMS